MAKNRYVNTRFWEDGYIINLLPDEKLLFLYFLTSPMTNIAGMYECPIKMIAIHTGFDRENLETMLNRFEGKIHYIDGWVYIRNFVKHQSSTSKTIKKGIEEGMKLVPNKVKEKIKEIEKLYDGEADLFVDEEETPVEKKKREDAEKLKKQKAEKIKKAIDNITASYNKYINTRAGLTDKAKAKLKIRLEEFTEEEILEGIKRFSNNTWRMCNNKSMGMEWFFRSEGQVLKWLELEKPEVKKVVKIELKK